MKWVRHVILLLLASGLAGTLFYPLLPPARLKLEPALIAECKTPARITVHWDAHRASPEGIILEISALGQEPRLWLNTQAVGHEQTGAWLQDGDSIALRASDGRMLARRTLATVPCDAD